MTMRYHSVPVPEPLVASVLRVVASWLAEHGEGDDLGEPTVGVASWSTFMETGDPGDIYGWFQSWLRPQEAAALRAFAEAPEHGLAAADLAGRLGISSASLAGVIGPFNRRLRRDGFPPAIESRLMTTTDGTRRRVKYLSIPPDLAKMIADYWPTHPPSTTKPATMRRPPRQRSEAAKEVFGEAPTTPGQRRVRTRRKK